MYKSYFHNSICLGDTIEKQLPKQLRQLVRLSLDILGQSIKDIYGPNLYQDVENIRAKYKDLRAKDFESLILEHKACGKKFSKNESLYNYQLAHSFSLSLELINCCENAYRSMRLSTRPKISSKKEFNPIIFVLTAHPTESRNSSAVHLLNAITEILIDYLKSVVSKNDLQDLLSNKIHYLLQIPISKSIKPSVLDEAEYIYSNLFKEKIMDRLCQYSISKQAVLIRTWVGGDKDGHPGVDEKSMLASMELSRKYCLEYISQKLDSCLDLVGKIYSENHLFKSLFSQLSSLQEQLDNLGEIQDQDAKNIAKFKSNIDKLVGSFQILLKTVPKELALVQSVFSLFPCLVVPLELREDASEIKLALSNPDSSIAKMLKLLHNISSPENPQNYVRGLVISMCQSSDDISNAFELSKTYLKKSELPIVPLFETRFALENAVSIVEKSLAKTNFKQAITKNWDNKLEIMLGYSDSAKESGAFFSRVHIQKALGELEKIIEKHSHIPIFFHGSGGSVARGGGSIEDQISWWPKSARERFKVTIQGEMIQRSFASPEILESKIDKIRSVFKSSNSSNALDTEAILNFSDKVAHKYSTLLSNKDFLDLVQLATPYSYLENLKLGSRPTKRKKTLEVLQLRAIPWVLCWTQTRLLLPVWYGMGSSWKELDKVQKTRIIHAYQENSLLKSFVNSLAYTMVKVDLSVGFFYIDNSELSPSQKKHFKALFQTEYLECLQFLKDISKKKSLLWFRPWIEESVRLRTTLIYPLNILEKEAMLTKDNRLLREAVAGVASGMQTTG